MTFTVKVDNGFKLPKIMDCFISLPKISMKKICKDYNIPYRKTVEDYVLQLDADWESSDSSSVESDVSDNYSDFDTSLTYEPPLNVPKKRGRKRKKLSEMYTNWTPTKRRRIADMESINSQKSDKSHNKSVNGLTEKRDKKSNKCTDNQSISGQSLKKKQTPKPLKFADISGINSTHYLSEFEDFCLSNDVKQTKTKKSSKSNKEVINKMSNNSLNETLSQKTFSSNKKSAKRKVRSAKGRPNRGDPNRCIEFLGERYKHSDIFDDYCQCEQNCELDELSMAFDLLVTSLEDNDLPKDLKIAAKGKQYSDLLTSEEDISDQNLDGFMPGVDDIYQQTIEEDFFDGYINDFVKKTTIPPIIKSSVIHSKPQAFTSDQLFNGQTSEAPTSDVQSVSSDPIKDINNT